MFNKKFYNKVKEAYMSANDTKLIADRKAVLIDGSVIGMLPDVDYLVYIKSDIRNVQIGESAIPFGWRVNLTVTDPKNKHDGFVICLRQDNLN